MPSGIVLSSGSAGATEEDLRRVMANAGYEVDEPEPESQEVEEPEAPEPEAPSRAKLREYEAACKRYIVKIDQCRQMYPDWDVVARTSFDVPALPPAVSQEIVLNGNPMVAHHLARHRDFTEKLLKMDDADAVRAIRDLAKRLDSPSEDATYKRTSRGTTAILTSGRTKQPVPHKRPAPGSAAEAAARGDYQAFKKLSPTQRSRNRMG